MLAQPSQDVLDTDDRVVNHRPERYDEPRQGHRVHGLAAPVEDQHRRQQRQRDREQTDHGDAPLEEETQNDHHDKQEAQQHGLRQVVDGQFDEVRLPEDVGVECDAGEAWLERLDRLLHAFGDLQRVAPGQLLEHQQQAR